jgi:predicted acylesterase/phospholipase RssA
MTWDTFGRFLRLLYFVRIPAICLLAMAGMACYTAISYDPLLRGLLDAGTSFYAFVALALTAFLAAAAALTCINVILYYAHQRYGGEGLTPGTSSPNPIVSLLGLLSAVIVVAAAGAYTEQPWWRIVLASLVGFADCLGLLLIAKFLQLRFSDAARSRNLEFILPVKHIPWIGRALDEMFGRTFTEEPPKMVQTMKASGGRVRQWLYELFAPAAAGYFEDGGPPYRLAIGHVYATVLTLVFGAVYLLLGWFRYVTLETPLPLSVPLLSVAMEAPALAYILLAMTVACYVLSAIAFFADRYRIPLFLAVAIVILITGQTPESDHFYHTKKSQVSLPSPSHILQAGPARPILVATAGGGIQASAWTARVLWELSKIDGFKNSVVAISGVSGGAVGAMHFGAQFDDPQKAYDNAKKNSLDEVAWGFVNPDLGRVLMPWVTLFLSDDLRQIDRAWALERSWEASGVPRAYLADWGRRAAQGGFPVFLFSTTIVESGSPMVMSTTQFRALQSFHRRYEGFDLRIATAARLSSSFPYVSPAARSSARPANMADFHLVDGGYYDNYGVHTLLHWLEEARGDKNEPGAMVVMIRSFPTVTRPDMKRHGWAYQVPAPADAYLNVRDSAQLSPSRRETHLFPNVTLVEFEFPNLGGACGNPPLSWKLRRPEIACIEEGWEKASKSADIEKLRTYLNGGST